MAERPNAPPEHDPPRRSSRRTVLNRYRVPNPEHYVGYVADDETPEMIMKKFEQLDRVMGESEEQSNTASHPQTSTDDRKPCCEENQSSCMTEGQLKKVLEATSALEVREAFRSDAEIFEHSDITDQDNSDEEFALSDEEAIWQDIEEPIEKQKRSHKGKTTKQVTSLPRPEGGVLMRKTKPKKKTGTGITQLRLPPPPLPQSWGRTVVPFGVPLANPPSQSLSETPSLATPPKQLRFVDISSVDWTSWYRRFIGVMINPGWTSGGSTQTLEQLPLPELCPEGFAFIWIPKSYLQRVWQIVKRWGFVYVENLTWVQLKPNNKICTGRDSHSLLPCSHLTLYLFRRGGKHIEIKHQRSSDVVFDVSHRFRVPKEAYVAIETMLPSFPGKLLELWSTRDASRPGWVHVCEEMQKGD